MGAGGARQDVLSAALEASAARYPPGGRLAVRYPLCHVACSLQGRSLSLLGLARLGSGRRAVALETCLYRNLASIARRHPRGSFCEGRLGPATAANRGFSAKRGWTFAPLHRVYALARHEGDRGRQDEGGEGPRRPRPRFQAKLGAPFPPIVLASHLRSRDSMNPCLSDPAQCTGTAMLTSRGLVAALLKLTNPICRRQLWERAAGTCIWAPPITALHANQLKVPRAGVPRSPKTLASR